LGNPNARLHVSGGSDVSLANEGGFLVLGEVNAENVAFDNNEIQARNNGAASTLYLQAEGGNVSLHVHQDVSRQVIITDAGFMGVGTNAPTARLHVMGSVRLGTSGTLFALGAQQENRVVSGSHNGTSASSSGSGFSITRTGTGEYSVSFVPAFGGTPNVVASSSNFDEDHLVTIRSLSNNGFQVVGRDVGNLSGDVQDTAFNFIAVGPV
jgi:hypothetical protein